MNIGPLSVNLTDMRTCTGCNIPKDEAEFYKKDHGKSYHAKCRTCYNAPGKIYLTLSEKERATLDQVQAKYNLNNHQEAIKLLIEKVDKAFNKVAK